MSDVGSITAEAFEILVVRELRKAGIEPVQVRRQPLHSSEPGFAFDLVARLECYGHRWRALIECSNHPRPVSAEDVSALRDRADEAHLVSALLCTTAAYAPEAVARGDLLRVALLRVVDAHHASTNAGWLQPGQLPAWAPEFKLELVTQAHPGRSLGANEPELILRELRASDSS